MIECGGENSQQRILNRRFKLLAHLLSSLVTLKTLDARLMEILLTFTYVIFNLTIQI